MNNGAAQLRRDWEREQASGSDARPIGYNDSKGQPLYAYMDEMPEPVYDDMTGEYQIDCEHWRAGLFTAMRSAAQFGWDASPNDTKRRHEQNGWRLIVQRLDSDIIQSAGVVPMFSFNFSTIQQAYNVLDTVLRLFGSHYQFVSSDYGMHRLSLAHQMIELLGRTSANGMTSGDYYNCESMTDDICTLRGDSLFVDGFLFVVADC